MPGFRICLLLVWGGMSTIGPHLLGRHGLLMVADRRVSAIPEDSAAAVAALGVPGLQVPGAGRPAGLRLPHPLQAHRVAVAEGVLQVEEVVVAGEEPSSCLLCFVGHQTGSSGVMQAVIFAG